MGRRNAVLLGALGCGSTSVAAGETSEGGADYVIRDAFSVSMKARSGGGTWRCPG